MHCTTTRGSLLNQRALLSLSTALVVLTLSSYGLAQGCVAARGAGMTCAPHELEDIAADPLEANVTYRWFKSGKHFTGTHEDTVRQAEGSEVINHSNFVDFSLAYHVDPRTSVTVTIPYVSHDRSQVVRKNDPQRTILDRFSTQSSGLADIRATADWWVFQPVAEAKGNILIGAGLALPTGKKDVRDIFQIYDPASGKILGVERTVDQSIQPGTGGYGVILDVYAYRALTSSLNLFFNGSYTATPQETNGVPTYRSNPYEAVMSIVDTYMARTGVELMIPSVQGLSLSLGARIEGVPVKDLVGGSNGFRRPGFSVAVEPGVGYEAHHWSARCYVPVAIARQRQRSVPDVQQTAATGIYSHGDAAFADYLIIASISRRF